MEILQYTSPDPEPPDKKLNTRAARKKANKGTNEFTIKCGWINL